MGRVIIFAIIAALIIGVVARGSAKARRQREEPPPLHKHPERLDQMLDPTDDA
jgi:hypothetical protein